MENSFLDWASRSTDANPIANLRGIIAQKVHNNGRQFETQEDLKYKLRIEWDDMGLEVLWNLVDSTSSRFLSMIVRQVVCIPWW